MDAHDGPPSQEGSRDSHHRYDGALGTSYHEAQRAEQWPETTRLERVAPELQQGDTGRTASPMRCTKDSHGQRLSPPRQGPARAHAEPAGMFGIFSLWRTFHSVVFYLTLVTGVAGLVGNGLVLWNLGFHIQKGPLSLYLLHLAAADFLFLGCHVGFSVVQAALGSQDTLYFVVTFLWFAAGLWLLAALSAECCLSDVCPACYRGCRPRHASGVLCALVWALTLPAVLLPASACGLLRDSARPLACLRYHVASVAWLLSLACVACVAGLVLFFWVACCSPRPRPKFFGVVVGSGLLLLLCGLPLVLSWSLRPLLGALLPAFPPLAALLACISGSARPLLYLVAGRRPGTRESLRAILQRALGEGAPLGAGGLSLPMAPYRGGPPLP